MDDNMLMEAADFLAADFLILAPLPETFNPWVYCWAWSLIHKNGRLQRALINKDSFIPICNTLILNRIYSRCMHMKADFGKPVSSAWHNSRMRQIHAHLCKSIYKHIYQNSYIQKNNKYEYMFIYVGETANKLMYLVTSLALPFLILIHVELMAINNYMYRRLSPGDFLILHNAPNSTFSFNTLIQFNIFHSNLWVVPVTENSDSHE